MVFSLCKSSFRISRAAWWPSLSGYCLLPSGSYASYLVGGYRRFHFRGRVTSPSGLTRIRRYSRSDRTRFTWHHHLQRCTANSGFYSVTGHSSSRHAGRTTTVASYHRRSHSPNGTSSGSSSSYLSGGYCPSRPIASRWKSRNRHRSRRCYSRPPTGRSLRSSLASSYSRPRLCPRCGRGASYLRALPLTLRSYSA